MAQVKFMAVLATIFRKCMIEPALDEGEILEDGKKRLWACIADTQPRVTLQMNNPQMVSLKWVKR
jgi:hypothetical protein